MGLRGYRDQAGDAGRYDGRPGLAAADETDRPGFVRMMWFLRFGVALLVLNTLLTFENAAPGIGVRVAPRLSFELCVMLGVLMGWVAFRVRRSPEQSELDRPSPGHPGSPMAHGQRGWNWLAGIVVLLGVVRYCDVTVGAVFGRPVSLYWDGRHALDALALALQAVPAWKVAMAGAAIVAALFIVHRLVRWSLEAVSSSLTWSPARSVVGFFVVAMIASFVAYRPGVRDTRWFFSLPVSPTLARQAAMVPAIIARGGRGSSLPASPDFNGNVAALKGADVIVVFAESYGVTTYDNPVQAAGLQQARDRFAQAIASSGRGVVSARVRSPTFAGGSWLAHAALLSGIDTKDPGVYDTLLTSTRPTLVSFFGHAGYRTVGWMPGLQKPWPEGAFFGYDRIAGFDSLGYTGIDFGYWHVPDQAAMGLLSEQELSPSSTSTSARPQVLRTQVSAASSTRAKAGIERPVADRRPSFVVFPTLGTHVPFRPLAPYIDDWSEVTRADAYSPAQLKTALAAPTEWKDAVPAYVESMRYQFTWLGGYLEQRAPHHLLMIVIGDHQPLSAVSGQNASWDVPIHVISDDPALLRQLTRHGFTPGLTPSSNTLSTMSQLTRLMIEIFSDPSV